MIRVTWEWLGADPALDIANTIAVSNGVEVDLLTAEGDFDRWAGFAARSPALVAEVSAVVASARTPILRMRGAIRTVLVAASRGSPLPRAAVRELNEVSRRAASWLELDEGGGIREASSADAVGRLLAIYARSAMEIAADPSRRLRVCPAPSCGMFFRQSRQAQRWCSVPCGTRARVARHHRARTASRTRTASRRAPRHDRS